MLLFSYPSPTSCLSKCSVFLKRSTKRCWKVLSTRKKTINATVCCLHFLVGAESFWETFLRVAELLFYFLDCDGQEVVVILKWVINENHQEWYYSSTTTILFFIYSVIVNSRLLKKNVFWWNIDPCFQQTHVFTWNQQIHHASPSM